MEIRGLTLEQIEQAVKQASKEYGGNLELAEFDYRVKLPEPIVTEHTYTARAAWRVLEYKEDGTKKDTGFSPYVPRHLVQYPPMSDEERHAAEYELCEKRAQEFQDSVDSGVYGLERYSTFVVEWVPAHEKTYTTTQTHDIRRGKGAPLNKRGDGWRVRFRIKSARRPGARVSNNPYTDKPKRIASACWHAHRDIFRAMYLINPDTRIKTSLEHYRNMEHFERSFRATARGETGPMGYAIRGIGDACNCDEGAFPHYAIEGLTPTQYADRLIYWNDKDDGIKAPKFERAMLPAYRDA